MKYAKFFLFAIIGAIGLAACTSATTGETTVQFSLTDAPVASASVKEVYVTFSALDINNSTSAGDTGSGWTSIPIDTTKEYELLSLSNGLSAALGSVPLSGGTQINQIRFAVSKIELVETADAVGAPRHAVTLSSSTGLKIVNAFDIPLSGSVTLVADFDVRKSLVNTGTGYKMKPVLRAVVENEAGEIHGTAPVGYLVFAYTSSVGTDISLSFTDPANDAESAAYDGAYTSATVKADGTYTLAFLEAGTYDLVLVKADDGTVGQVANDVLVESAKNTVQNIALP
ncbi:MAG: DUF4382 domain-containing protein [Treponemataceae bacterium]